MFKSTSKNLQARMNRSEIADTKNIAGIDDSVWKEASAKRIDLVEKKRQLESDLAKVNELIKSAGRKLHSSGRAVNSNLFESWMSKRANLIARKKEVDHQLYEIKKMARSRESVDERSFERVFLQTAQRMLAEPVYNRLVAAAIHSIEEAQS